jgi:MGT family glycosyltransferase
MSRVAFFCIPAQGHTNPTLGVVRELLARGHEVYYYSYETMRAKIEATGAQFIPCDAFDPQTRLSKEDGARLGKDLAFSTQLIVDLTLALDDALIAEMQRLRPDVIVADSMAFWGKLIARKLGVPFVSSTTTFAFNRYSAKTMQQKGPGVWQMLKSMPGIQKNIRRLQAKGYDVKSVLDIIANDEKTDTIVYTSRLFQPYADTFGAHYAFVGPILRAQTEEWPREQCPTVYISLGTVDNDHADFYQTVLRAVAGESYRAVLSVGTQTNIEALGDIPENCIVRNTVDQIAVLQCADLFVTHCGMNSVSEALWFGVPLLLWPQTPEQQSVASRVQELKAGRALDVASAERIRASIRTALADPTLKESAAHIQESLRACGGAKEAADFILKQVAAKIE